MDIRQFLTRCRKDSPALTQSLWLSSLFVLIVIVILIFAPIANAGPIVVDDQFDFATGNYGWTATPVGASSLPPLSDRWNWNQNNSKRWTVRSDPYVGGTSSWTGNHLTSGTIDVAKQLPQGAGPVDLVRISVVHAYNLPFGTQAYPMTAGQITYSINGGTFMGISGTAFQQGTVASVDAAFRPADPTWSKYVNTQTLATPTYTPGAGIPLLATNGASFSGTSTNYYTWLVPSVAVIDVTGSQLSTLQLRFTNATFGAGCPSNAGWDLALVQVDCYAPEPGAIGMAAAGIVMLSILGWRSRRYRAATTAPRDRG